MRFLKLLLILFVLGYGGLKAYVWYDIRSNVNKVIVAVSPFVDITYDSIFSSLFDGVVGITGIVIRPKMTSDEFTIQEMSFSVPSIFDIYGLGSRFKDEGFPEYIGFEMKKVNVDLDSEIFLMLDDMKEQGAELQASGNPFLIERLDTLGCGNIEKFDVNDLSAMGYNPLNLDIAVNLAFKKIEEQVNVDVNVTDSDLYSVKFSLQAGFDLNQLMSASLQFVEPEISKIKIEYNDTGYYKLRNKYCADLNEGSIEQYINENIAQLATELGAVFPKNIVDIYRQFMMSGGSFIVNLNPAEAIILSGLEFYKTADVLDILGMEIVINGVNVDADDIEWNTESEKTAIEKSNRSNPATTRNPPKKSGFVKAGKYQKVKKSRLSRYIGKNIQVDTTTGKRRQGQLESVDEERIRILMKIGNGEFSFPVKLEEIVQARVYR